MKYVKLFKSLRIPFLKKDFSSITKDNLYSLKMEMNNDKKEGGSLEKVENKPTNKEGKKSKRFDRKTKHKMRLEKKVKKEESEYVDFRKGLKSEKFESYYQAQLKPYFQDEKEFYVFVEKLKEKLPSVCRINTAHPYWREFQKKLISGEYAQKYFKNQEIPFQIKIKNLTNLDEFINLVFQMDISRHDLKRNDEYKVFHKFIFSSVAAGLISRQEAVSMIPPMLLNVKSNARVFDMCAAPGSKTAQFLEILYKNYDYFDLNSIKNDTANDNNVDRAFLMTHQVKRLNTAGMVIVSHDGQSFPTLYDDKEERILFDNILCDVPCSSDAVMRKLPHRWKIWTPRESYGLHKLQLILLRRGISLLKENGTIIYSTCSLNPIENEAVITQIMREYEGEIEILDVSKSFENCHVKCRSGLTDWKVIVENKTNDKELVEITSKEDLLLKEYKHMVEESCFPESKAIMEKLYNIQNCVRIFPHDSDTSGFFITVMKRVKPSENTPKSYNPNSKPIAKYKKGFSIIDDETSKWLKDYYGLTDEFPLEQLITQSKKEKKINYISKGVYNFLMSDKRNNLNVMNAGVRMFGFNKLKNYKNELVHCTYRVCQDGMLYVIPYMRKRVLFCETNFFKKALKEIDVLHKDIDDSGLREELTKLKSGCVVLVNSKKKFDTNLFNDDKAYIEFLRENFIDAICCYTSAVRLSTMLNEDHQHVFNLKYDI